MIYRYDFQTIFQRSESSQNHVQRCDRRWKFENFEIFYFLVFRFPWSILHIHFGCRPIHSARVGSPLAFYALYISIQSCDYFKRFSVILICVSRMILVIALFRRQATGLFFGSVRAALMGGGRTHRGLDLQLRPGVFYDSCPLPLISLRSVWVLWQLYGSVRAVW